VVEELQLCLWVSLRLQCTANERSLQRLPRHALTKGHFENVRLDGLSFFVTVYFPGSLHEGNGEIQPIIDERATPERRDALFRIMSGQNF
jgi:hypothetical protein